MLDQPVDNNCHTSEQSLNQLSCHKRSRNNFSLPTTRHTLTAWPSAIARKDHSSASAILQGTPDYALIGWLAETMLSLHKNKTRRTHWSGPCGRGSCRISKK